jgi:hypothetical protein
VSKAYLWDNNQNLTFIEQEWNTAYFETPEGGCKGDDSAIISKIRQISSIVSNKLRTDFTMEDALSLRRRESWTPAVWRLIFFAIPVFNSGSHFITAGAEDSTASLYDVENEDVRRNYHTLVLVSDDLTTVSLVDKKKQELFVFGGRIPITETDRERISFHTSKHRYAVKSCKLVNQDVRVSATAKKESLCYGTLTLTV